MLHCGAKQQHDDKRVPSAKRAPPERVRCIARANVLLPVLA
jgi:hypothetical protein